MSRPDRLVVVTGTGTEVGKTWVAAATLSELRARGHRVAARKPVQSFAPDDAAPTDADVLAAATGEPAGEVCPSHRRYPAALAPPMAAEVLGSPPFTIADLAAETTWPDGVAIGMVESAGGVRSPLAADGDTVDLVRALAPDRLVLVADAGLGTISAVRLAAGALGETRLHVALNRFEEHDDLHRRNLAWLTDTDGLDVVTGPAALAARLLDA
jgi:dethiobiotin synthetase